MWRIGGRAAARAQARRFSGLARTLRVCERVVHLCGVEVKRRGLAERAGDAAEDALRAPHAADLRPGGTVLAHTRDVTTPGARLLLTQNHAKVRIASTLSTPWHSQMPRDSHHVQLLHEEHVGLLLDEVHL